MRFSNVLLPRVRRAALSALAGFTVALAPSLAPAAVITQWTFNTISGSGTVNNTPSPTTGSGTASLVGMGTPNATKGADLIPVSTDGSVNTSGGATNSSDPATLGTALGNNYEWRVRNNTQSGGDNGWSGTTQLLSGAKFTTSTVGKQNISVSFDAFATNGFSRYMQFEYSLDGTTFTPLGAPTDFFATNNGWGNGLSFDLSSIVGANNNPNFAFEFLSAFSPDPFVDDSGSHLANTAFRKAMYTGAGTVTDTHYDSTKGNIRLDMVTIGGTAIAPEPSTITLALLGGLGALVSVARRRR